MLKYTLETLKEINSRFCSSHYLTEADVKMANSYVELIENSRSEIIPRIGDIVQYTDEYGDYYATAHIEEIYETDEVNVCENPYVPFIWENENNNGICCSTSGGAWINLPKDKLIYIGKKEKSFCDWGNCGACADGAIEFKANVNVWEYTSSENKFISKINNKPFTTKEFNRMKINYYPNKKDSPYIYFGEAIAWKSDLQLQAWLRTFRAEVFDWGYNGMYVWYWKNEEHHVSPEEYENIIGIEDTMLCNGVRKCKRIYDTDNQIVHTYFVWYRDEPGDDWRKIAMEQNKIRDELYTLDWYTPVNQYAINEIKSGKVNIIDINFLKKEHECYE